MMFTLSANAIQKAKRIAAQREALRQRRKDKGYTVVAMTVEGGIIKVPANGWRDAIDVMGGFPVSYTVEVRKAGIVHAARRASAIINSLTK